MPYVDRSTGSSTLSTVPTASGENTALSESTQLDASRPDSASLQSVQQNLPAPTMESGAEASTSVVPATVCLFVSFVFRLLHPSNCFFHSVHALPRLAVALFLLKRMARYAKNVNYASRNIKRKRKSNISLNHASSSRSKLRRKDQCRVAYHEPQSEILSIIIIFVSSLFIHPDLNPHQRMVCY